MHRSGPRSTAPTVLASAASWPSTGCSEDGGNWPPLGKSFVQDALCSEGGFQSRASFSARCSTLGDTARNQAGARSWFLGRAWPQEAMSPGQALPLLGALVSILEKRGGTEPADL